MLTLTRKEINVVALAAVVFATLTYRVVDKVLGMIPVLGGLIPDTANDAGCPSVLGYLVHVVVFAVAVKFVLPRL